VATASGQGEIEHRHCDGHRTQRRVFLERIQRAMAAQGRAHGAVFFSAGALAIVFAVLAMRNDMPDFLWGASCGGPPGSLDRSVYSSVATQSSAAFEPSDSDSFGRGICLHLEELISAVRRHWLRSALRRETQRLSSVGSEQTSNTALLSRRTTQ
jgi:hypothetical protein